MFKRLFWLTVGFLGGMTSSFWLARKLRSTVARVAPGKLAGGAANAARGVAADVKAAMQEGRTGMRERETDLRAEIGRPAP